MVCLFAWLYVCLLSTFTSLALALAVSILVPATRIDRCRNFEVDLGGCNPAVGWMLGQGDLDGLGWTWLDRGFRWLERWTGGLGWTWLDLVGLGWTRGLRWLDCWMVGQGEVGWMQRCDPESLLLSVGATRVS